MEAATVEPLNDSANTNTSNLARVLIADDHQPMLERAVSCLQPHFEIVGTASNGTMLVEEALRLRPDVIVSDILMPGLTGLEAARRLRESGLSAKLIFISVYGGDEFVQACFEEGGSGYVSKTRMSTDLVLAITEVLNGRRFVSPSA